MLLSLELTRVLVCLAVFAVLLALSAPLKGQTETKPVANPLDACNVVWDNPSLNAKGSMPLGNGDIGLNVWVERDGDLLLYIAKTDAWEDNSRLVKLGRLRVQITPNPFTAGSPFRQELRLRTGEIVITAGAEGKQVVLRVWADANRPAVHVEARGQKEFELTVKLELWRKTGAAVIADVGDVVATPTVDVRKDYATTWLSLEPEVVVPGQKDRVLWYHHNARSPWQTTCKQLGLEELIGKMPDPILHRTFGGLIKGEGLVSAGDSGLKSDRARMEQAATIYILSMHPAKPELWIEGIGKTAARVDATPIEQARAEHARWWEEFWNRSWIFVSSNRSPALPVNVHPWRVGVDSAGENRFGGTIGGPRVVGRALSPAEIAELARQKPSTETALAEEALTSGCTVAAWIKPGAAEAGRILDKCTAGKPDGFTFDAYPGLSLRWIVGNDTMIQPNCLKAGEWQHVAATADAGTGVRRIYLNGKLAREERGDPEAMRITRAYTLQRFVAACAGRGAFPIKFNGSLFAVGTNEDPDVRQWGAAYWFQNTRLQYWPMLASGDYEMMKPFFKMYLDALPVAKARCRVYYKHDGACYCETIQFWGGAYLFENSYLRHYFQGMLELLRMGLDYYACTQDDQFAKTCLLPLAGEILTFYDKHYGRDERGRILFKPAQALETWQDCVNPVPEIAGLDSVLEGLSALPANLVDKRQLEFWQRLRKELPPIPTGIANGKKVIIPAQTFADEKNMENPELYAVFPYHRFGVGKEGLAMARDTFAARKFRLDFGWCQDAIQAAHLGLAEEAAASVLKRSASISKDAPFPAFWSTTFNPIPDEDHGAAMVIALQAMLLQADGDKILLLPAWPRGWDVDFRLHAPKRTTVHAVVRGGKIETLEVTPKDRAKDVVLP